MKEITMSQEPLSPEWEEVERIWEKWVDIPLPQTVDDAWKSEMHETAEVLLALAFLNVDAGTLPSEITNSRERGKDIGEIVASAMRASLLIGIECGTHDKLAPRTDDFIRAEVKKASPLLKATSQPVFSYAKNLFASLVPSNQMSLEAMQKNISDLNSRVLKGQLGCFRIGLEYSTKV
jgi:hypothetical protein